MAHTVAKIEQPSLLGHSITVKSIAKYTGDSHGGYIEGQDTFGHWFDVPSHWVTIYNCECDD